MKILVVTENPDLRRALHDALGPAHSIADLPGENPGQPIPREAFDCVFLDQNPKVELRTMVANIRRAMTAYTYVVAVAPADHPDLWRAGVNAVVTTPLDGKAVDAIVANIDRLKKTIRHLGDEKEDFPSAGGIISRSAFNQIFLSGIDRAGRYNERTSMIFFGIENFDDILKHDGPTTADTLSARLAQHLARLRRQSDIIAQTGRGEFCVLLQRPQFDKEPVEASRRFAESLTSIDMGSDLRAEMSVEIKLFELPSGSLAALHRVVYSPNKA